ncbi:hypothetical protein B0H19DRAFT_1224477 [Mycena capillaripes]|nr:hypothetical protein B0H19DRAFT_1224477 [Mycena capillaripes]
MQPRIREIQSMKSAVKIAETRLKCSRASFNRGIAGHTLARMSLKPRAELDGGPFIWPINQKMVLPTARKTGFQFLQDRDLSGVEVDLGKNEIFSESDPFSSNFTTPWDHKTESIGRRTRMDGGRRAGYFGPPPHESTKQKRPSVIASGDDDGVTAR